MIYVGVDIGKDELVAGLVCDVGGSIAKPRVFSNNVTGFKRLQKWLERIGGGPYHLCMESTGVYGEKLAHAFLGKSNFTVSIINPAQIHAFARAVLKRTKTDKVDAELIAVFAATQKPRPWKPEPDHMRHLKNVVRRLESLKKDLVVEMNQLHALKKRHVASRDVIQSVKRHIAYLEKEIARLEDVCKEFSNNHSDLRRDFELLVSIPGIGEVSAFKLLAELGSSVHRWGIKQIVAHSGLSPKEKSSGSSVRGKSRIAKAGNRFLRKALYMPAMVACRFNPVLKAFYDKLLDAGKPKKVALIACMRKFLHIVYGVLKNKTVFNPNLHPGIA